jgi:hypothetical protein
MRRTVRSAIERASSSSPSSTFCRTASTSAERGEATKAVQQDRDWPPFHERLEAEAPASREEECLRNGAALPGFDYGTAPFPADRLPIELRPLH